MWKCSCVTSAFRTEPVTSSSHKPSPSSHSRQWPLLASAPRMTFGAPKKRDSIFISSNQWIFTSFKLFSIRSTLVRPGLVQSSRMATDVRHRFRRSNTRACGYDSTPILRSALLPEFDFARTVGALRIHTAPRRIINERLENVFLAPLAI